MHHLCQRLFGAVAEKQRIGTEVLRQLRKTLRIRAGTDQGHRLPRQRRGAQQRADPLGLIEAAAINEAISDQENRLLLLAEEKGHVFAPIRREPDEGQHEHAIWVEKTRGGKRVIKETRNYIYGYTPVVDSWGVVKAQQGTPLDYLERIQIANEVLCDRIKFLGVVKQGSQVSIRTEQPFYQGTEASPREIEGFLASKGFVAVKARESDATYFNPQTKVLLYDVEPKNVVKLRDGRIMPIDVMATRLGTEEPERAE